MRILFRKAFTVLDREATRRDALLERLCSFSRQNPTVFYCSFVNFRVWMVLSFVINLAM